MPDTWIELRDSLLANRRINPIFAKLNSVSARNTGPGKHQPRLLDRHTQRLGEIIDRCLSIRKDVRDLEVLETKSAVDYQLFLRTSAIDEEIEIRKLQLDIKAEESDAYKSAAAIFSKTNSLEAGIQGAVFGRASSLWDEAQNLKKIEALIRERWSAVRAYQKAYSERSSESGNAHNYGERAVNLLRLFECLAEEGLARAAAISIGMKLVHNWHAAELPREINLSLLDDFSIWAIRAQRELSIRAEQDQVFEVIIPLVQPWFDGGRSLVSADDFIKAVDTSGEKSARIKFTLDASCFGGRSIALKGMGLSFGSAFKLILDVGIDSQQTADSFTRLAVRLTPPSHNYPNSNAEQFSLEMGAVALHETGKPSAYYDGPSIENVDPFGEWELEVHPWLVWKDASQQTLSKGILGERIRDIKLFFRAIAPSR